MISKKARVNMEKIQIPAYLTADIHQDKEDHPDLDLFNLSLVDLFKCSKCHEFFHQAAGYPAHMRREHKQPCLEGSCTSAFISKIDMLKHVKHLHREINVDKVG